MTKSGPKNGRVAPEKSAKPENGVITNENVTSNDKNKNELIAFT